MIERINSDELAKSPKNMSLRATRSNLFDSATADTPRNDLGMTFYEFFNHQSTIDNQQS